MVEQDSDWPTQSCVQAVEIDSHQDAGMDP